MPPGGSLGWETAIPDGGRGASLPSYSAGNSRGEDRPRSQSCQGPAGSDGKKHTGQVRYVFLYLKKNILGCGVRRVHLSWLRGGHRFQKESLGQKHMGRTRGSGEGLHPPAPLGRVGTVCTGGQCPPDPMGQRGCGHHGWPTASPLAGGRAEAYALRRVLSREAEWRLAGASLQDLEGVQAPHQSYHAGLRPASWGQSQGGLSVPSEQTRMKGTQDPNQHTRGVSHTHSYQRNGKPRCTAMCSYTNETMAHTTHHQAAGQAAQGPG